MQESFCALGNPGGGCTLEAFDSLLVGEQGGCGGRCDVNGFIQVSKATKLVWLCRL